MNSQNKSYIGLTIGPIFQTLSKVKSTRALFAASYLYSYAMREILETLKNKGVSEAQILLPAMTNTATAGVGLYPDRMIMEGNDADFQKLQEARESVIQQLATDTQVGVDYLKKYFQFYCFKGDFEVGEQTINEINAVLDTLELRKAYPDKESDGLIQFLNEKRGSFLIRDAFRKDDARFPSLIQITSDELRFINEDKYKKAITQFVHNAESNRSDVDVDNSLIEAFKGDDFKRDRNDIKSLFRSYHKYIAIVQADGDSIGKHVKEQLKGDSAAIKDFSQKLLKFGMEAAELIKKFGGAPIFIGGDDLLFFAPIKNDKGGTESDGGTVFSLIRQIDERFHSHFPKAQGDPTMSYGISMTYYKYPMNEARDLAYHTMYEAKNKQIYTNKNAVAFNLIKHSGQDIKCGLEKGFGTGRNAYDLFLDLLETTLMDEKANFINSITYVLEFQRETINHLMTLEDKDDRIENFFDNNFNEDVHKKNKRFMGGIVDLIKQLYTEYPINVEKGREPLDKLYAMLRFIHFVTSDEQ